MKSLKMTLVAGALSLIVAMPAFAEELQTASVVAAPTEKVQTVQVDTPIEFTATEMQSLFEQDAQPVQLASLSLQEMKETEGALAPFVIPLIGITARLAHHGAHHTFRWIGAQPHLQLNTWRAGISGSGWVFRIPTRFW